MPTETSLPSMSGTAKTELEALEIKLLLEAIHECYGYDFREYAHASLRRRVLGMVAKEGVQTITGLLERVLHDPNCMKRFLLALSVNVTSMFRDPEVFLLLRQRVIPILRTYPFVRIWHAGCATGEEVYSMAILLQEEGLYDRCRIYATDMDEVVLKQARDGIFSLEQMPLYAENYLRAGGTGDLTRYYTAAYGNGMFGSSLKENIVFSQHNLVMDSSFNEFHLIMCRNVLIYFSQPLQKRVHQLLYSSLVNFGVMALGSKETLKFMPHEHDYEQMEVGYKVYKRIR